MSDSGQSTESVVPVGYQGVAGAYSEAAVNEYFNGASFKVDARPFESFEDVFVAVERGDIPFGFVPIENSLGGSIHTNFDLLLRYNLFVIGELDFRVRHCLLALPGVKREDIRHVHSHPQALAQCDEYIRRMGAKPVLEYDTAGSAKLVRERDARNAAAIASHLAAKYYNMEILDEGIEDDKTNFTRFILLRRTPAVPPSLAAESKSMIVFSLRDEPGSLFKALSVFALRDIELSKIESRPGRKVFLKQAREGAQRYADAALANGSINENEHHFFSYVREPDESEASAAKARAYQALFYVEFGLSIGNERAHRALVHLSEIAYFVRVLGSYPRSSSRFVNVTGASGDAFSSSSAIVPVQVQSEPGLHVAIVGFGRFGQFLARFFVNAGHRVSASNLRSDYSDKAAELGVSYYQTSEELCDSHPDVVIFAVSILSFENVLRSFPVDKLASALVVDVLSVKAHPRKVMLDVLPETSDILCTHPMYGPDSGGREWTGLPFVYDKVRVREHHRCARFLRFFSDEGCRMVPMACDEHDGLSAGSQFVTHLTGRLLASLALKTTPINTKGFEQLLHLVENTCRDSWDLFVALFRHNDYSRHHLQLLSDALAKMKKDLTEDEASSENAVVTAETIDSAAAAHSNVGEAVQFNARVAAVRMSGTTRVTDLAAQMRRQGKDVISFSVGEPDFAPPPEATEAIVHALANDGTHYTAVGGTFDLRSAISRYLKQHRSIEYTPEEVVVSNGGKQAILQALMCMCRAGDEVLIPSPFWVSYPEMATLAGATPRIVDTTEETNFLLTPDVLERNITSMTRVLILCNPSNPTGAVHTPADLEALAEVLRRHPHVWIVSDEMYSEILYDEVAFQAFASLDGMRERTFTVHGFSKAFAMTGLRLGYVAAPRLRIADELRKLQSQTTSCASSLSQAAGVACLTKVLPLDGKPGTDYVAKSVEKFANRRALVLDALRRTPGVQLNYQPRGAFYVFFDVSAMIGRRTRSDRKIRDTFELCEHLIEDWGLALVPGTPFGSPNHVRMSYAASEDVLREGLSRLANAAIELMSADP